MLSSSRVLGIVIASVVIVVVCGWYMLKSTYKRVALRRSPHPVAPVVVTATTIPVPPAGHLQNPSVITATSYSVPAHHGYPPQPQTVMYPPANHSIPSYPMPQPQPQIEHNPPPYDQVVRGEVYQKQAPYNPNYSGAP